MSVQIVIALNMYDELEKKGVILDHVSLGKLLGVPVVPTVSSRGKGISAQYLDIELLENDKEYSKSITC